MPTVSSACAHQSLTSFGKTQSLIAFLAVIFLAITLSLSAYANVTITTASDTEKEKYIKASLETLLRQYPIQQWVYMEKIMVDETARTPHSHPVVTMSTQQEYLNSTTKLLSTFLHEQFHWHVIINGKPTKKAFRTRIESQFPNPQWQRPYGSGDKGGTLSHLIVCYLEYKALSSLIGEKKAYANLASNEYYTWVYKTVLDPANKEIFEGLLDEFGLMIQA
ncbi:hypothetical protein [Marinibactrum halimedae]|uniref:Uncharacterized protein n=1 Tax=Marinibactrum halimedae TaxID=1444977 RepID=A0AA37T468_9GAMM|nr:hypothetical protein [Marinibactrum halimedae]MCD9458596.1 hypothetical protein [Marinibactrum halimedae]GLS26535.1 hypothetical protein GCM10007877_22510 [Marinibactrum halimedae]